MLSAASVLRILAHFLPVVLSILTGAHLLLQPQSTPAIPVNLIRPLGQCLLPDSYAIPYPRCTVPSFTLLYTDATHALHILHTNITYLSALTPSSALLPFIDALWDVQDALSTAAHGGALVKLRHSTGALSDAASDAFNSAARDINAHRTETSLQSSGTTHRLLHCFTHWVEASRKSFNILLNASNLHLPNFNLSNVPATKLHFPTLPLPILQFLEIRLPFFPDRTSTPTTQDAIDASTKGELAIYTDFLTMLSSHTAHTMLEPLAAYRQDLDTLLAAITHTEALGRRCGGTFRQDWRSAVEQFQGFSSSDSSAGSATHGHRSQPAGNGRKASMVEFQARFNSYEALGQLLVSAEPIMRVLRERIFGIVEGQETCHAAVQALMKELSAEIHRVGKTMLAPGNSTDLTPERTHPPADSQEQIAEQNHSLGPQIPLATNDATVLPRSSSPGKHFRIDSEIETRMLSWTRRAGVLQATNSG